MPRSSFSRNPLLRVSRPISACSRCRTAKVKCDGKLPACTACQKAGREDECSSANDQFARGKERSYVAALELRIEKLERRLDYAKSRKESVGNYESETVSPESTDRRDSLAYIRDAIHRKAAKTRENSDVNTLVSDFGFMSVNATTRDFELGANSMTFARLVLAATLREPVPPSVEINLPPKQVVNSIIQYFMSNIYTLFPCFSETAILTIADEIYQQDQRAIRDTDYWLFYMVLAIASTSQSTTIHDAYYDNGVEYLAKALKHGDRALVPGTVAQVQCLLLLTIYSMLDPAHFDSWHLIGVTARAVVDLGLHQDPPSSSVPDRSVMDMRRRVFYSVYALDRAVSMVHARTFSFTDENVNVAFPTALSGSRKSSDSAAISGPQSADPALLLFQLRRAQSYWYQELYQSDPTPLLDPTSFLWQMCQDMREWGDSLPESLPVGIRRMFEQELRYSYVYCIAPSVRAPQITDYTRTLIFEYSIEYLNAMHEIAHSGLNSAFYTYHDALKVYFMGNQLLAVLRDAEDILLSGRPVPVPPAQPGCPIPPPTPKRPAQPNNNAAQDAVQRGLWCLERVPQTFSKYGERWEESKLLLGSFQQQSSEVLNRLRQRQTNNQSPVMQQQILQQQQQQQQQQRQQQLQAQLGQYQTGVPSNAYDNSQQPWVGINVSQMMHGGPHR